MSRQRTGNNLILVVIFALCVLFLIIASLVLKFITVLGESSFDGSHRFTIVVTDKENNIAYLSVDPTLKQSSKLIVKDATLTEVLSTVPVGVDGIIVLSSDFDPAESIPSLIQTVLIKRNQLRENVTFIDLMRMYLALKTSSDQTHEEVISLSFDESEVDLSDLFTDSAIIDEDLTVAIENATRVSGVGGTLEDVLTTMGASVISVETATSESPHSKIIYYGDLSYTVMKIQSLLGFPVEYQEGVGIADISIIIGEDGLENHMFQALYTQ